MEKVIAVQNSHYEKLNQLENLLTIIIKNMDDDGSCEKAPVPTAAEIRLRQATLGNVLDDIQQNNTPSNHSVL